jgi:hypothetical protein
MPRAARRANVIKHRALSSACASSSSLASCVRAAQTPRPADGEQLPRGGSARKPLKGPYYIIPAVDPRHLVYRLQCFHRQARVVHVLPRCQFPRVPGPLLALCVVWYRYHRSTCARAPARCLPAASSPWPAPSSLPTLPQVLRTRAPPARGPCRACGVGFSPQALRPWCLVALRQPLPSPLKP